MIVGNIIAIIIISICLIIAIRNDYDTLIYYFLIIANIIDILGKVYL